MFSKSFGSVEDCRRFDRWFRAHAKRHGVDPMRHKIDLKIESHLPYSMARLAIKLGKAMAKREDDAIINAISHADL